MAEQSGVPHGLVMKERKELRVTGVSEVVSFDEDAVVMKTPLGVLMVHGKKLQLKTLSPNGGQVDISGNISALVYQEPKPSGGWVRRLFG